MQRVLILAVVLWMAGCTANRIDIQQGNILSKEKLALVKPGMDEQQVRFALGSPLIEDPFHPERWDYFYSLRENGKEKLTYHVTLHFDQGKLAQIEEQGAIPETERAALEAISHGGNTFRRP